MKKSYFTLLLFVLLAHLASAQNQWTWMSGTKNANVNGNYGTLRVASATNLPGSRAGAASWTDAQGNFWIFGGRGNGESGTGLLNDLWKFEHASGQWTWMGGAKGVNTSGTYGIPGLPLPTNYPGSRENAVTWTDNNGNLWLFGGSGHAARDATGLLNDLWRYSPTTNLWTWVNGTDRADQDGRYGRRGNPSLLNYPGGRSMSTAWKDKQGNLWLFGGRGYSSESDISHLNDLWKYLPGSNSWAWMKGDDDEKAEARYGDKGEFSNRNTPGGKRGSTGWTNNQGHFFLFGGGTSDGLSAELWEFDPGTNEWAWISGGTNVNQQPQFTEKGVPDPNGNPGSRMLATGWIDDEGDLWLFGGRGYGGGQGPNPLNNLWKYTTSTGAWTFLKGDASVFPTAEYGSKGIAAVNNTPGGTENASGWRDPAGNIWIFGGQSSEGNLNQSWRFSSCQGGMITPASATICEGGSQVLTATTGGKSYEWRRNNVVIAGQTKSTLKVAEPGTYTVVVKYGDCSVQASNNAVITLATAPTGTISPASASLCAGATQLLTATGGASYEWFLNGNRIEGKTTDTLTVSQAGTYSVIITNGTCVGPASNEVVITQTPPPTGAITPEAAGICEGGSQVLTVSGGDSYQWQLNGENIEGQTGATITVNSPGTYSALIVSGECNAPASNTAVVSLLDNAGSRYTDITTTANKPVQLSARPIGITYMWTPATGLDNPSSPTPMATIGANQEYRVLITTDQGCSVTDTVLVKIGVVENKAFVPTAFTPNSNNVNDRLRPLGNLSTINYFKVFNRWGNMVFQTTQIGSGWDGYYKGVLQPPDTYTWVLSGTTADGQPIKQSGKTLLIR